MEAVATATELIEAFNDSDWTRFAAACTSHILYEEKGSNRSSRGPDAFIETVKTWRTAFPDLRGKIFSSSGAGTNALLEITWVGTHDGPLELPTGTLPATGKTVEFDDAQVYTIQGDKVAGLRNYVDLVTMMSQLAAPPQSTVAQDLVELFNAGNIDGIRPLVDPGMVYEETGTGRRIQGVDDYLELCRGWRQALPDVAGKVNSILQSGNTVALEIRWTGTQTGPLATPTGEIPASGKPIDAQASFWCTVRDGKITEIHHYLDVLTMLQQIGAVG